TSFINALADHTYLHSFPTRRSSDLETHGKAGKSAAGVKQVTIPTVPQPSAAQDAATPQIKDQTGNVPAESQAGHKAGTTATKSRSEEHTSELQSPDHLVCRLLLEKK